MQQGGNGNVNGNSTPGPSTLSSAPTPNGGRAGARSRHPSGQSAQLLARNPEPSSDGIHFATTLVMALQTNDVLMGQLRETLGLRDEDLEGMKVGFGGVWDRFGVMKRQGEERGPPALLEAVNGDADGEGEEDAVGEDVDVDVDADADGVGEVGVE